MDYLNNKNSQYILHFPFQDEVDIFYLFKEELNTKIKISEEITILCTIKDKNSFFINQVNINNLNVIYIEETSLFETLKTINSKFTLIIKEKDAVILKDLTDNFLNDFLNLDQDFVFAGMSFPVPTGNIENYNLLFFTGLYKYINSSLIFGFTDKIRNFIYKFNPNLFKKNYNFEEFNAIYRTILSDMFFKEGFKKSFVDSYAKLFSTISRGCYIVDNLKYKEIITGFDNNYLFWGNF